MRIASRSSSSSARVGESSATLWERSAATQRPTLFVAVDLGAGSGRVFLAGVGPGELLLEEVRRFQYPPRGDGRPPALGRGADLRRDRRRAARGGGAGAGARAARAEHRRRQLGRGLRPPRRRRAAASRTPSATATRGRRACPRRSSSASRGPRSSAAPASSSSTSTRSSSSRRTAARACPPRPARLLLIPDLVNHRLTGRAVTEYTNATTTQLVGAETRRMGLARSSSASTCPRHLLGEIVPAGTDLGPLARERRGGAGARRRARGRPRHPRHGQRGGGRPPRRGLGLHLLRHLVAGRGRARGARSSNAEVARANFTNEGGAYGTIRFLKNVMGLWILERCRKEWEEDGVADADTTPCSRRWPRSSARPGSSSPTTRGCSTRRA